MRDAIHRQRRSLMGLAISVTCLLSACASAPPLRWLSLPLPASGAASYAGAPQADLPVLVVRRIGVPEYLQTNKVRYRISGSVLGEWPGLQWAERLEAGMTDHLVMRLQAALPNWTVCGRICPPGLPRATLGLDFMPLDYLKGSGELQASAHWQITVHRKPGSASAHTPTTSGMHAYALPVQPDSGEGQAVAIGHLLDLVSHDIADSLPAIDTQP